MDHWRRQAASRRAVAWGFLRGLNAHYALLQEAVPLDVPAGLCVHREEGIAGKGRWGSAVVSFGRPIKEVRVARSLYSKSKLATDFHRTMPGCVAVADAGVGPLLVSVYGAFDEGYTVTTVHRLLSDLTPLLDASSKRGVVLAGDLNVSTQVNAPHRARHRNALERFATLGLVDCLALQRPSRSKLEGCPCEDSPCRHVRTHRHSNSSVPWQDDYLFVSDSLVRRVKACRVIDHGEPDPWQLSDHCPIELELEI